MHRNRKINTARNHQNSVTNRPTVRNIGPTLRICQVNVEGMSRPKGDYLAKVSAEEKKIDILMIQETHIETMDGMEVRGKVDGLDLIVAEGSRVHGIATYVRKNISDIRIIESKSSEGIYSSTHIRVGSISVTNVYKSPAAQWTDRVLNVQPHPAVYAGDFNSHNGEWGYGNDDMNGELVVSWASINELKLVHDAKDRSIFYSKVHKTESNPDLFRKRRFRRFSAKS